MKRHSILSLHTLLLLLLVAAGPGALAQQYRFPGNGALKSYTLCSLSNISILPPTQNNSTLGNPLSGAIELEANATIRITLDNYALCDASCQVMIYDGDDTTGILLALVDSESQLGTDPSFEARSGKMHLAFSTTGRDSCFEHFQFSVQALYPDPDITATSLNSADLVITDDDHSHWMLRYGLSSSNMDRVVSLNAPLFTIPDLIEGRQYFYQVVNTYSFNAVSDNCPAQSFTTECIVQASSDVMPYSAVIRWDDTIHNRWMIRYGTNRNNLNLIARSQEQFSTLQSLSENTTYYYLVSSDTAAALPSQCTVKSFRTPCDFEYFGCIEYTDFYSCRNTCYAGSFGNPMASRAVVDYGQYSGDSRHTVNTVRTVDPRASRNGRVLWTIPPGETESVRLGNWSTGAQAEAITYRYHVDTRYNDLLVMKYAVVLQNPGHGRDDQPRFDFAISDENGTPINPSCNAATFIPGYQGTESWYEGNGCNWKDWTTIALDLSPLNGRTIYVTLTMRDCAAGGHYGYAYFVLRCSNRRIESLHCGADVANTFKAPEGFAYAWFDMEEPSRILSRADTLFVDHIGTYGCTMTFQGQDASASCQFTSTAVAGPRFPFARFDTLCTDTVSCKFRFRMSNNSVITEDEEHTRLTTYPCESYEWIIDDNIRFTTTDLVYDFPYGTHKLQLVAKLSGGLCSDTLTMSVYRYPVCRVYDTLYPSICADSSFQFLDTVVTDAGRYRRDLGLFTTTVFLDVRPLAPLDTVADECDSMAWDYGMVYESCTQVRHVRSVLDCDSTRTLHLTIRYSSDTLFFDTCIENVLPRAVGYTAFSDTVSDTLLHVLNAKQCDSSIRYSLHVWRNIYDTFDTTLCRHFLPIDWGPFTFDHQCTQTKNLEGQGMHGEDSIVTLTVFVNPDYYNYNADTMADESLPHRFRDRTYTQTVSNDSFYMRSVNGCDSVVFYSLWVDYHIVTCDKFLQFPNVITANGDGINDRFVIVNLLNQDCYQHNRLVIYNRWGRVVYQARDICRDEDFWDPAAHDMPQGTYYFYFFGSGARGELSRSGVVEVFR